MFERSYRKYLFGGQLNSNPVHYTFNGTGWKRGKRTCACVRMDPTAAVRSLTRACVRLR